MEKIAIGGGLPADVVDLEEEPPKNLRELARAKGVDVGDLVVCILDRPRHTDLIAKTRDAGARIMLIRDGDVAGVIATTQPESGVDIYMGIGGAPQGVLAAAALGCVGGQMHGRLVLRNDEEKTQADKCGITDFDKKYGVPDMARGDITFAATGVTSGAMLAGVRRHLGIAVTQSMVMRSRTGTLRYIEAHHRLGRLGGAGLKDA
ncbi:MAG: fructose-bisphosphatase class II, partial [Alphaproteobacteria bacterium]|nr:fructose-bisphosphatase class II [Alphaproteobacteria bacterium]